MAARIRDANRYDPLSEERLAKLESKLIARLPDDYRAFLLQYNSGRPAACQFTFAMEGEEQKSILEWLFAIHDRPYEEDEDWDPYATEVLPPYFAQ